MWKPRSRRNVVIAFALIFCAYEVIRLLTSAYGSVLRETESSMLSRMDDIEAWNYIRLNQLWKVQGLSKDDIGGGMQTWQAKHLLTQLRGSGRNIKHVCETGFFRGGSSLFWLMNFPGSQVKSFDVYASSAAVTWLKDRFPGRFEIFVGNTLETLPQVAALYPRWCDVVLIDGSHDGWDPYHDILNFRPAIHERTIIVADDTFDVVNRDENSPPVSFTNNHPCTMSWKRALDEGIIRKSSLFPRMCDTFGKSSEWYLGHCIGEYNMS